MEMRGSSNTALKENSLADKKEIAADWFCQLRDQICAEFEKIETEFSASPHPHIPTSKFVRTSWQRTEGGGGEISLMKGRVFEKVGVNISTVYGEFSEAMQKEIPGANKNPKFWASGISLVAHMRSPLVPAVHMNTRMVCLGDEKIWRCGDGEKKRDGISPHPHIPPSPHPSWFGGGSDLTPMIPNDADTKDFHAAFKTCCNKFDPEYYEKFKKWCDEYFFLKHRNEPRGVGGIFYDYVNSGNWDNDFAFTQAVGKTFAEIYPALVRRHMHEAWTDEQRQQQLKKRGRYVEFNLLYDRGTRFGLMTGGNTDAILMSLPPEVTW
jgi:coproporphyrinogen III oxidase